VFIPCIGTTSILSWINRKTNSVAWVRERTIPTERTPLVGEVSANFSILSWIPLQTLISDIGYNGHPILLLVYYNEGLLYLWSFGTLKSEGNFLLFTAFYFWAHFLLSLVTWDEILLICSSVSWYIVHGKSSEVSEGHFAPIFRIGKLEKQEINMKHVVNRSNVWLTNTVLLSAD
jgi:hypothetical protein